jgi:hypothetical protein
MTRAEWTLTGAIAVLCGLGILCYFSSSPNPPLLLWAVEALVPALTLALLVSLWRRGKRAVAVALMAVLVIAEANFSLLPYLLGLKELPLFRGYSYVSSDGGFFAGGSTCLKTNDCTWCGVQRNFTEYVQEHPGVRLLRLDPIRPWELWNWFDYATHPHWRLGYADPLPEPSYELRTTDPLPRLPPPPL